MRCPPCSEPSAQSAIHCRPPASKRIGLLVHQPLERHCVTEKSAARSDRLADHSQHANRPVAILRWLVPSVVIVSLIPDFSIGLADTEPAEAKPSPLRSYGTGQAVRCRSLRKEARFGWLFGLG